MINGVPDMENGVGAPVVAEATDVEEDAFAANWHPVAKATSYSVDCYSAEGMAADGTHPILEEHFTDTGSTATPDNPTQLGGYGIMSLDDMTDVAGWYGSVVVIADGMLGCRGNGYGDVELYTPLLCLQNSNGTYKAEIRVYGEEGETFAVQGTKELAYTKFESTGIHDITFEIPKGILKDRLMIYTVGNSLFLIDSFRITQDLKAGDDVLRYLISGSATAPNTFAPVAGIDPSKGEKYAYTVSAIYTKYGKSYRSTLSNVATVKLGAGVGVNVNFDEETVSLMANGLELTLTTQRPSDISIYSVSGLSVVGLDRIENRATYVLPSKGIYIVKIGQKTMKVNIQ